MSSVEPTVPSKICPVCHVEFTPIRFSKDAHRAGSNMRRLMCSERCKTAKDSQSPAHAAWVEKHRDKLTAQRAQRAAMINERRRQRYAQDGRVQRARAKAYYRTNREKVLGKYFINRVALAAKARAYRAAHPEKVKAQYRKHYKIHRVRILARGSKWRGDNRNKFVVILQSRRAAKLGVAMNDFTVEQWREMQIHFKHRCVYCGAEARGRLTMDHILPLSKGGNHTRSNIVPACKACNCRKNAGHPPVPVQPMLL